MYSVRRRLMLQLAIGFAVLIAAAGLFIEGMLEERVTGEFDAALIAKARALVQLTEQEDGQIELDYDAAFMPEFERADKPDYFEFWLDDGRVLYQSRRLREQGQHLPMSPTLTETPQVSDVALPDGRPGRIVQIGFVPRGPEAEVDDPVQPMNPAAVDRAAGVRGLYLVVARGRERLDSLLGRMRLAVFGAGGLAIVFAVVFVWRALVSGFRPLELIAAQVRELDAESLDSRVTLPKTPRELAPIISQLNALLDRLHSSFERERRFAGNVAHELRTPIAELRSLAEVGGKWPEDRQAVSRFFVDVHDIAGRMERIIVDLLLLARCQAGVETSEKVPLGLRTVAAETWAKLAPAAEQAGLRFALDVPRDLVVESDPGKLAIIFTNVFGNAVSYAPPGSEVRCVGTREAGRFRLDVTNAAEPLTSADLAHLAEPFWRKDEARSSGDHAGLGLSVVSALSVLLGLDVGFEQGENGTFRVRIEGSAPRNRSPSS